VYLGETPHLSRFGVVTKVRQGKTKHRVILDVKQSRVKECTAKVHRVPLPRITDVVFDILNMLAELPLDEAEDLELLVLDFVDAFWNIPLAPAERKFFVGRLRGRYYVFLRAAQGSRNGPLAWAAVVSLIMRLVQAALFARGACPLRLNTYVDDPIAVVRGSRSSRRQLVAELILLLRALGFPLAFVKGQLGPVVDWIGLTVKAERAAVVVTISAQRIQELLELTRGGLRCNVVSRKWLQSYAGKANSFASVLVFWRPFLQYLWAALYSSVDPNAPQNCIWVKQFRISLEWIEAFLTAQTGDLCRRFSVDAVRGNGPRVTMTFDASPWGAGGFLAVDGALTSWFATSFTAEDERAVGITFGTSSAQQVAEALAVLFGMRAWLPHWVELAPQLQVRSDSVAALSMVARMQTSSPQLAFIARELALTLSMSCIRPKVVEHTPGVCNQLADALSRRFQPGVSWRVPAALRDIMEVSVSRPPSYYRTAPAPR